MSDVFGERTIGAQLYNYIIQDAIVAFVNSIRPQGPAQADLVQSLLGQFAMGASNLLTMFGYPPVN